MPQALQLTCWGKKYMGDHWEPTAVNSRFIRECEIVKRRKTGLPSGHWIAPLHVLWEKKHRASGHNERILAPNPGFRHF